ncbi:MAG: 50S ribosomal protein L13 [Parcubacteria group bacterium]|nr:50S ribosomal protein L13 [Parcubacteria group bacterium]
MQRNTHTIDASGVTLGRVATQAARFLMGKHKASYVPYQDEGDLVVIVNYGSVKFTGSKMEQKRYFRPTTRPGSLRSETLWQLWQRRPNEVLRKAVYGMLPKNTLRKQMIKRLSINDATT